MAKMANRSKIEGEENASDPSCVVPPKLANSDFELSVKSWRRVPDDLGMNPPA